MPPGTKIRQQECSEILGVSRTPLREAFQRLDADGWVRLRARQGADVRPLSVDEAEGIFIMRVLYETIAARVSAVRHDACDELAARKLIALAAVEEGRPGSSADADDANTRFHEYVYGLRSERLPPELTAAIRRHWARAMRYRRFYWSAPGAAPSSEIAHREIFEAWVGRDAEATEHAVARHILIALRDMMRRIDAEREPSEALRQLAARHAVELAR
jgi:DNA-binding GntR family transcriptional regulator